jgi:regulator of cell morphogenesis and NO signaling
MDPRFTVSTPLAAIALVSPAAAAALDGIGLDYCCRGHRALGVACAEAGLDPDRVLSQVATALGAAPPPDFGQADAEHEPLPALLDRIESTHHAYTRDALAHARSLLDRVLARHLGRHDELRAVAVAVDALSGDLLPHLLKEEGVLFPWIRALAAETLTSGRTSIGPAIEVMEHEHEHTAALLGALAEVTDDFEAPPDACASYRDLYDTLRGLRADLLRHLSLENHVVFPRALALACRAASEEVGRPAAP